MRLVALILFLFVITSPVHAFSDEDLAYVQKELGVDPSEMQANAVMSEAERDRIAKEVEEDFKSGNQQLIRNRFEQAIRGWVRYSAFVLRKKGYDSEATRIESEFQTRYAQSLYELPHGGGSWPDLAEEEHDLGDFPPMSQWLADWYTNLELILGKRLCELLHLDDINTINYAVPVVFHPCGDVRFPPPVPWGPLTYENHFTPFAGVVTYWVVWGVCTGVSYGAGIVLICTPIAEVAERAMVCCLAPKLSDATYNFFVPNRCN